MSNRPEPGKSGSRTAGSPAPSPECGGTVATATARGEAQRTASAPTIRTPRTGRPSAKEREVTDPWPYQRNASGEGIIHQRLSRQAPGNPKPVGVLQGRFTAR